MSNINIALPIEAGVVRGLHVSDIVSVTGTIVTARDEAHKFLMEGIKGNLNSVAMEVFNKAKDYLGGSAIYHAGPVVANRKEGPSIVAVGPTTSIREEIYTREVIEHLGVRLVMGKGGMGDRTLSALVDFGSAYLQLTGGAAALLADKVVRVKDVLLRDELGDTEAMWVLEVNELPAVVTMSSAGESLHKRVAEEAAANFEKVRANG